MKKILEHTPAIIILIAGIISFIYYDIKTNEIVKQFEKKYPIITIEDSINNTVIDLSDGNVEIMRNSPLHSYITLDDGTKRRITAVCDDRSIFLDNILTLDSRLIKVSKSEFIWIENVSGIDTLAYRFELCDDSGYPLVNK